MKKKLVYQSANIELFWNIYIEQDKLIQQFGPIGSEGQTLVEEFENSDAAIEEAKRLLCSKLNKGYKQVDHEDIDTMAQNPSSNSLNT
ncbi:WGR domain-containing protein (plasmid) [Leptospira sp. WS60.C2]